MLSDRTVRLLYEAVVPGHLDRMAAGLKVKVAVGLLYGNAASALVEAARTILKARPGLRGPLTGLVDGLLDTGRLVGTGHIISPGLAFRRRSCCLYRRTTGEEKCGDCSLLARSLPKPQP